jgi:hypothetical protein
MKNFKNKRTAILAIILLGLLVLAYKVMFAPTEDLSNDENVIASQRVEGILQEIESINFDTSIMENQSFKSLKSIEIPPLSLPVGRKNPFAPTSGSN